MGTGSAIYRIILLLHIATAIVGFGGMIAHGAYNAKAFASTAGEAAVLLKTTQAVTKIAHGALYMLFLLGIVLVALSDSEISFAAPWISASFVVWFAVVGVAHGMVRPAIQALTDKASELAPDTAMSGDGEVTSLAKKLATGEGLTQLLLVVALVLMIWQPGN